MEIFLITTLVLVTFCAGWQYIKRNRLHRQVHEAAVRQLLELVQTGDITAFGYYPERYRNENKWAPLVFMGGADWEFHFHPGWEHKSHGTVPDEVMVVIYLLFWTDELDIKDVLDDLATRAETLSRTFKAVRSVDPRTKHKTLKARKLQALVA